MASRSLAASSPDEGSSGKQLPSHDCVTRLLEGKERKLSEFDSALSVNYSVEKSTEPSLGTLLPQQSKRSAPASPPETLGCTCKKSACLRLHCRCFSAGGCCSAACRCAGCLNTAECEPLRQFVKEKTKVISPWAFEDRVVKVDGEEKLYAFGCTCKRGCRLNYCPCFKNKVPCSELCRCQGCANDTAEIDPQKLRKVWKRTVRAKHQLSFVQSPEGQVTIQFLPLR